MTKHLHISIGPVQGFVAQARRTRDFWAGSFLLSWMAGQLIAETLRQGGEIRFPSVGTKDNPTDPLLAAILDKPFANSPHPFIGSLPNRFKASVPGSLEPENVVNVAKQKWRALTEQVWRKFVDPVADRGRYTSATWDRQVEGFWEIQWVMGANPGDDSDNSWLGARKNWRSHWPPEEGGDHCTVMGDWQELSGYVRSREQQQQDEFWHAVQQRTGRLDLRDGERLCAIALVKRLFPNLEKQVLKETIGWPMGSRNWPSTVYLAVAPWLTHLAEDKTRREHLSTYIKAVGEAVGENFEQLKSEGSSSLPALKALGETAYLNGNLFLETALANPRATPLSGGNESGIDDPDSNTRKRLIEALRKLVKTVGGPAKPYYALLLMDGDRLGKLLRENEDQAISKSLAKFVQHVPKIVQGHNGVTVYAGGDDVLALLPITQAVECAMMLRKEYGSAFKKLVHESDRDPATASCSVIFAHYHNPLRDVMNLAHEELDGAAKERNGRDSLALAVLLPGGVNALWVARFGELPHALVNLRERIRQKDYSTGFFYHLRQRYGSLLTSSLPEDRHALIMAEYVKGALIKDGGKQQKAAVSDLVAACGMQRGDESPNENSGFQLDGAFIARFLAETTCFDTQGKEGTS